MADVKWNMGTFVAIGNQVNAEVCIPAAERVAAAARDEHHPELPPFIHVKTDTRGFPDWAHARVVNGHPHNMGIEAKHGVLARALGAA
jgi:hypothetical protein